MRGGVKPVGVLRRKFIPLLAKTSHLLWKTTCMFSCSPDLFPLLLKTPFWWESGGSDGNPVLLCAAWDLHFSSHNRDCRHFLTRRTKQIWALVTNSISFQVPLGGSAGVPWAGGGNFQCNFHLSGFPPRVHGDFTNIMLLNFSSMVQSRSNVF